MNTFDKYVMLVESENLVNLAHRWHDKAKRLETKVTRGDEHQKVAYHEAMVAYHSILAKHLEKEGDTKGAQEHENAVEAHEEHIKSVSKKLAVESVEQIEERINKPQGHEHTGDPISDASKQGTGPKKKMMGQTSGLVQTIAKIISKGKDNDTAEN